MARNDNYYLAADVRELDRLAIEECGIPGFTLMQRAGSATLNALLQEWPDTSTILCFCGSGNNGGDGYVIAALAAEQGLNPTVIALGKPEKLQGDASRARELAVSKGVGIVSLDAFLTPGQSPVNNHTVIVDALLGTGLTGAVRGEYKGAIRWINQSGGLVVATDIPSGLCSDTGRIPGEAVTANVTVTFIGRKLGQVTGEGPATCGKLVFDDLGVPGNIYQKVIPRTS